MGSPWRTPSAGGEDVDVGTIEYEEGGRVVMGPCCRAGKCWRIFEKSLGEVPPPKGIECIDRVETGDVGVAKTGVLLVW